MSTKRSLEEIHADITVTELTLEKAKRRLVELEAELQSDPANIRLTLAQHLGGRCPAYQWVNGGRLTKLRYEHSVAGKNQSWTCTMILDGKERTFRAHTNAVGHWISLDMDKIAFVTAEYAAVSMACGKPGDRRDAWNVVWHECGDDAKTLAQALFCMSIHYSK
jgi:hypothetical protein